MFRLLIFTVLVAAASALATGFWFRRGRRMVRVLVAVVGGLATFCVAWVVIAGLFVVALFEPWPIGRRQGPDTAFAHACYAEFLGGALPLDVSGVYCRREWGVGGDSITSIRFAFRWTSTVDAIVKRLQLEEVPESEQGSVRYLAGPGWWPERVRLSAVRDVYQRRRIEFLWVDRRAMEAYYQHAQF